MFAIVSQLKGFLMWPNSSKLNAIGASVGEKDRTRAYHGKEIQEKLKPYEYDVPSTIEFAIQHVRQLALYLLFTHSLALGIIQFSYSFLYV